MIMDKEKKFQLYVLAGLTAVILISFFVGWKFGLIYLLIFLVAIFCASFFVLIEFYLRVQHNIDDNAKIINEIKNEIENKIENKIEINKENIINRINEIGRVADEIKKAEADISDKINGERELYEEVVDFFDNLLNYLEENKIDKKIEGLNQKIEESKDSHNKMQNKMVVLLQQILEHQEDQTNFLKEEIRKLKNEHPRETPAK